MAEGIAAITTTNNPAATGTLVNKSLGAHLKSELTYKDVSAIGMLHNVSTQEIYS